MRETSTEITCLRELDPATSGRSQRQTAVTKLENIERTELGPLLGLKLESVLELADRSLETGASADELMRVVALVGAQMHPLALRWLDALAADPPDGLTEFVTAVRDKARGRFRALLICLGVD